jgi:hypothetical protein
MPDVRGGRGQGHVSPPPPPGADDGTGWGPLWQSTQLLWKDMTGRLSIVSRWFADHTAHLYVRIPSSQLADIKVSPSDCLYS